jgi:hypothetical protein
VAYHCGQFRELISVVLAETDPALLSDSAVNLLLGTAAQESAFGTYLRQLGGGPALGAFQMEPRTFLWLKDKFENRYSVVNERLPSELEWDLRLAIIMARLRYRVIPEPLPSPTDINGLARYYKSHYNSIHGRATVEAFVRNYHHYVATSASRS